jgi:hypothetical protein
MTDKVYTSLYPLDFSGYTLYDDVIQSISNYYYHKFEPGGFVYHMLCNDFVGAACRADSWNREKLYDYANWLANRMPTGAWGSKEIVDTWLRSDHNAA